MDLSNMGATIDISKNGILKSWIRDGQMIIIRAQLETKFGKLPKWAEERLSRPKSTDVERWAKKLITADTLEGVLGKK